MSLFPYMREAAPDCPILSCSLWPALAARTPKVAPEDHLLARLLCFIVLTLGRSHACARELTGASTATRSIGRGSARSGSFADDGAGEINSTLPASGSISLRSTEETTRAIEACGSNSLLGVGERINSLPAELRRASRKLATSG